MNVLFICSGNTCRSPMAAVLMDKIANEEKLDIRIESAGLAAFEGVQASKGAVEAVKKYGADLSAHRSKTVTKDLIEQSDIILTMTEAQKRALMPYAGGKLYTLGEYAGQGGDIPDPYGGDDKVYGACAEAIYAALKAAAEKIGKEL